MVCDRPSTPHGRDDTGIKPFLFYRVMHLAALPINTNVRFHPEIPLIAFLLLVHFGVANFLLVLGRRWGREQRGIGYRAFFHHQALGFKLGVDTSEEDSSKTLPSLPCAWWRR